MGKGTRPLQPQAEERHQRNFHQYKATPPTQKDSKGEVRAGTAVHWREEEEAASRRREDVLGIWRERDLVFTGGLHWELEREECNCDRVAPKWKG